MTTSIDYYRALTSGQKRGFLAGLLRFGLWLVSVPYGLAVNVRNWLFERGWKRSYKIAVPVISVGNLTLGGTGKTPCVEYLAEFFRRHEVCVVILSRGYGGNGGRNDEALVLEDNLPDVPHLQGADRVALAQTAIEELESELLILDDGFQHRRLKRDLDLVLIDCSNPWGHGYMFPRGWLREPRNSLGRAGLVLLTRCDQADATARERIKETVRRFNPHAPVVETSHRPVGLMNCRQQTAELESLRGNPVAAFCGLGNPEAFRQTLVALGAQLVDFRSFPDHHGYTREDVEGLRRWAQQQAKGCVMVTTQKDLVKLRLERLDSHELWAVRIRLQVDSGQELLEQMLAGVMTTVV